MRMIQDSLMGRVNEKLEEFLPLFIQNPRHHQPSANPERLAQARCSPQAVEVGDCSLPNAASSAMARLNVALLAH